MVGLVTFYAFIHAYDTAGYGLFTTAITFVTLFAVVVDFGLTLTTTQMISEDGANEKKIMGNLVAIRLLTAALFMGLAPLVAKLFPNVDGVHNLILIGSLTYFLNSVSNVFLGVFQKRLKMGLVTVAELGGRIISLIGVLLCGQMGWGIGTATAAFTVGAVWQVVIMSGLAFKETGFGLEFDRALWKEIFYRSAPIGLSIFFNLLYLKGDILFLWGYGISAEQIGQYGSAYKVLDVLTMIPTTFMGLVLPVLTLAWSKGDTEKFGQTLKATFDNFIYAGVPLMFGAFAVGVPLMRAVKSDLTLAGQLLYLLGPAGLMVFLGALFGHAILAIGEQRKMVKWYLIVAMIALIGYGVLTPLIGVWGAAIVTLVSEGLIALIAWLKVRKATDIRLGFSAILQSLASAILMVVAIRGIWFMPIWWQIIGGIAVYLVVLGWVGGPKIKDWIKMTIN